MHPKDAKRLAIFICIFTALTAILLACASIWSLGEILVIEGTSCCLPIQCNRTALNIMMMTPPSSQSMNNNEPRILSSSPTAKQSGLCPFISPDDARRMNCLAEVATVYSLADYPNCSITENMISRCTNAGVQQDMSFPRDDGIVTCSMGLATAVFLLLLLYVLGSDGYFSICRKCFGGGGRNFKLTLSIVLFFLVIVSCTVGLFFISEPLELALRDYQIEMAPRQSPSRENLFLMKKSSTSSTLTSEPIRFNGQCGSELSYSEASVVGFLSIPSSDSSSSSEVIPLHRPLTMMTVLFGVCFFWAVVLVSISWKNINASPTGSVFGVLLWKENDDNIETGLLSSQHEMTRTTKNRNSLMKIDDYHPSASVDDDDVDEHDEQRREAMMRQYLIEEGLIDDSVVALREEHEEKLFLEKLKLEKKQRMKREELMKAYPDLKELHSKRRERGDEGILHVPLLLNDYFSDSQNSPNNNQKGGRGNSQVVITDEEISRLREFMRTNGEDVVDDDGEDDNGQKNHFHHQFDRDIELYRRERDQIRREQKRLEKMLLMKKNYGLQQPDQPQQRSNNNNEFHNDDNASVDSLESSISQRIFQHQHRSNQRSTSTQNSNNNNNGIRRSKSGTFYYRSTSLSASPPPQQQNNDDQQHQQQNVITMSPTPPDKTFHIDPFLTLHQQQQQQSNNNNKKNAKMLPRETTLEFNEHHPQYITALESSRRRNPGTDRGPHFPSHHENHQFDGFFFVDSDNNQSPNGTTSSAHHHKSPSPLSPAALASPYRGGETETPRQTVIIDQNPLAQMMNARTTFSNGGDQRMRNTTADEIDNDVHHIIPQAVEDANNTFFTERKRVTAGHQNQHQQPVPMWMKNQVGTMTTDGSGRVMI